MTIESLIEQLQDRDASARWDAARALEKYGDSRAVDALTAALEDRADFVRQAAREALSKIENSGRALHVPFGLTRPVKSKRFRVECMTAVLGACRGDNTVSSAEQKKEML